MYINGAILHSFVYLAILLVRIQLLSLAPYGMLSTGADCLLLLLDFSSPVPRLLVPAKLSNTYEYVRVRAD